MYMFQKKYSLPQNMKPLVVICYAAPVVFAMFIHADAADTATRPGPPGPPTPPAPPKPPGPPSPPSPPKQPYVSIVMRNI